MTPVEPPAGLSQTGRKLWRAVAGGFELGGPGGALLREVCRTADAIDTLQALLDAEGLTSNSSQGLRVHPALVELRQQRIALARLLVALRIPMGDEGDGRTQRRGVRGVYEVRAGGAA